GGDWGPAAQLVFFAAAILVLALLLFSERLRAQLRVFLSKHFFRNRYDYRQEWLRLMSTLDSPDEQGLPLSKRAVKALADILGAERGLLFVRHQEDGPFCCEAGWNTPTSPVRVPADSSLVRFFNRTGWVIDAREYRLYPERYGDLDQDFSSLGLEDLRFAIPLFTAERLVGFVLLAHPAT